MLYIILEHVKVILFCTLDLSSFQEGFVLNSFQHNMNHMKMGHRIYRPIK